VTEYATYKRKAGNLWLGEETNEPVVCGQVDKFDVVFTVLTIKLGKP